MPAFQSSQFYEGERGSADKGNDLDFNVANTNPSFGGSVTHTAKNDKSWWAVDLGKRIKVKSVVITNRVDCCRKSHYLDHTSRMIIKNLDKLLLLFHPFNSKHNCCSGKTVLFHHWCL